MELVFIKQISKFLVLIGLIGIGFLLGTLFITNVSGLEVDVEYTFERDILYDEINPEYNDSFNVRNYNDYEPNGHFPATYSFENDIIGTEPNGWTTYEQGISEIKVISELDNHNKIVEGYDNSTGSCGIINYFDNQVEGIVEFWIRRTSGQAVIYLRSSIGRAIYLTMTSGNAWWYYDGSYNHFGSQIINTWYHIQIDFNCTSDTFDMYQDSIIQDGGGFGFENVVDSIHSFSLNSESGAKDYYVYFDAIGYLWDYNATYFDSTYTFDDDTVGTEPDGWTVNTAGGCSVSIIANLDDQVNVLKLYDGSSSGSSQVYRSDINYELNQYIEIDLAISILTEVQYITLKYSGTSLIELLIENNDLFYYDSGYSQYSIKNNFITSNNFFTLKIQLDDTLDTWDAYIDGNLELADIPYFTTSGGSVNYISFDTDYTPTLYDFYVDNIHVSSDSYSFVYIPSIVYNYEIGDNLESDIELVDSGLEADKYEFKFHRWSVSEIQDGYDNPNGWTDIEDGGDDTNCLEEDEGLIEFNSHTQRTIGLEKTDFSCTSDNLNVSYKFEIKQITGSSSSYFKFNIYSSDNTEVLQVWVNGIGELRCDYGLLTTGIIIDTNYIVKLSLNYTDVVVGRWDIEFYTEGVLTYSYGNLPLMSAGKNGLKEIVIETYAYNSTYQVYLDSIGIYSDGHSITTEFYGLGIHVADHSFWYFESHNLLKLNLIGNNITLYMDSGDYVSTPPPSPERKIIVDSKNYTGLETLNLYNYLYDDYYVHHYIWGGFLWFYVFDSLESFESLIIEGVRLIEGNNTYELIHTDNGIEMDEGYFYTISSNRLGFKLTVNDDGLEYIQAEFNVENIACENRSINFISNINGVSNGALKCSYVSGTSTYFDFSYYTSTTSIILPQKETIDKLIIIIIDNDLLENDYTTGYVSNIKLIYYPNIGISITTLNLVGVMIPLIIMIAPPLAMSVKFGKKIIVPMFILMSIICFVSSLIPIWLFFVIMFSSSAFLVVKRKTRESEI